MKVSYQDIKVQLDSLQQKVDFIMGAFSLKQVGAGGVPEEKTLAEVYKELTWQGLTDKQ